MLCPVSRPITTLVWVLLRDNSRALVDGSGPEINSRVCLCLLKVPRHNARCCFPQVYSSSFTDSSNGESSEIEKWMWKRWTKSMNSGQTSDIRKNSFIDTFQWNILLIPIPIFDIRIILKSCCNSITILDSWYNEQWSIHKDFNYYLPFVVKLLSCKKEVGDRCKLWCPALSTGYSASPNSQITAMEQVLSYKQASSCPSTAVAQWLRCATNRKVAGLIPACVIGFFIHIKSFRSRYGSGVESASNRNEYQNYFQGVKTAGA